MSDLRSLIGYLKGEISEESEHLQRKNEAYADGHRGWKGKDYYIDNGIIEGMQRSPGDGRILVHPEGDRLRRHPRRDPGGLRRRRGG